MFFRLILAVVALSLSSATSSLRGDGLSSNSTNSVTESETPAGSHRELYDTAVSYITCEHLGSNVAAYTVDFTYNGVDYTFEGETTESQIAEVDNEMGFIAIFDLSGLLSHTDFSARFVSGGMQILWGSTMDAQANGPTQSTNTGMHYGEGDWIY